MLPLNLGGMIVYEALLALKLNLRLPAIPGSDESINGVANRQHSSADSFAALVTNAVAVR
jgi:CRISPR/Cas system CMR subunit Cmr6 (Cas7 group RAMP superfamily)